MTSLTRSGRAFLRKSGGNPRGSQVCWVLKDCFHLGATVVGRTKQEKVWSRFRSALLLHLSSGIDSVLILKLNEYPCVSFPHLILLIKVPNVLQLSVH